MKQILTGLTVAVLMMTACNNNNQRSDAYGNFESIPVMVASQGQGQLIMFTIEEGQQLESGTVVGVIDTMQHHLQREQLNASMAATQTRLQTVNAQIRAQEVQLKNLRRELERVENLRMDGAATKKQQDDLEGNLDLMKAQINVYETQKSTISAERNAIHAQADLLEDKISKSVITNPSPGVVLQRYKQEGEIVAPGQILYKIAPLDRLILRAYISGRQLSQAAIGQQVTVKFDGSEGIEEIRGEITWIASEAEFTPKIIQTRDERVNLVYAMKVKVSNDGRLKIGMPGEVQF
jgi:HlyD family secretion protein